MRTISRIKGLFCALIVAAGVIGVGVIEVKTLGPSDQGISVGAMHSARDGNYTRRHGFRAGCRCI
jgi:hypothetical protein